MPPCEPAMLLKYCWQLFTRPPQPSQSARALKRPQSNSDKDHFTSRHGCWFDFKPTVLERINHCSMTYQVKRSVGDLVFHIAHTTVRGKKKIWTSLILPWPGSNLLSWEALTQMWWEEGKLSFQARAFLNELMKFASIIIFNLGAKFSLHCMKSWCCDATKGTHEPSTLITTSLYNSQIPVSN